MSKFINPFTDIGFKRIFGQEVSKPILLAFLNSLLEGEHRIKDLTLLDKEQPGESLDNRSLIYDVYCETDTGEHIIVEMQNRTQPYFKERSIYYLSRSISRQGEPGRDWGYSDLKAVYLVAFMNFRQSGISERIRTDVCLMDMETKMPFSDKVRMIYLQLPYFRKDVDECETIYDKLLYVLKNMEVLDRMPWLAKEAVFARLAQIADVASLDRQERIRYDEDLRIYRDTIAVMEGQYQEGMEKGMQQGMEKGMRQGMEKGIQQGAAQNSRDNARRMKAKGMSDEIITEITGLTAQEIAEL